MSEGHLESGDGFENAVVLELRHRFAREIAAATAALALTRAGCIGDRPLLDQAIDRLAHHARAEMLLFDPDTPEFGDAVIELCRCIAIYRAERPIFRVRTIGRLLVFDLGVMRLLLLALSELLNNAITGLEHSRGPIKVTIRQRHDVLDILVSHRCDDPMKMRMSEVLIDALSKIIGPLRASFTCTFEAGQVLLRVIVPHQG